MSRCRKLLLWGAFAANPLAALVIVLVVALKPAPTEATRQIKKFELGMTIEQVQDVIGKDTAFPWLVRRDAHLQSDEFFWRYKDGSVLVLLFDNGRLTMLDVLSSLDPSWHERLRYRLRKGGLPL